MTEDKEINKRLQKELQEEGINPKDVFVITSKFRMFSTSEAEKLAKKTAKFISHNIYDSKYREQIVKLKLRRNNPKRTEPELLYDTIIRIQNSPLIGYPEDVRNVKKGRK